MPRRSDESAGDLDGLGEPDAIHLDAGREGALEPARQRGVEQDEDAAIVRPPHQPAVGLPEPPAREPVVVAPAPKNPAPGLVQDVGPGPRHPVEDDEPQAAPGHVDAVPHRVGAEQAGVGLAAEDVDQRGRVERVYVLGPEREAGFVQRARDTLVHAAQPRDRGEETQSAATRGRKERAVGRRHPVGRGPPDVGHHQHAGLCAVVEGGWEGCADHRRLQVSAARGRLGGSPIVFRIAAAVPQRRRSDERAVGAPHDERSEGDRRVHVVAVHADIDVAPVDAGDREPIDKARGVGGVFDVLRQFLVGDRRRRHVREHGAPRVELLAHAPLDAAHHGLDALALGGLQALGLRVEMRRELSREPHERPGDPGQRRLQGRRSLSHAGNQRVHRRFDAVAAAGLRRARHDLAPHQREEALARALRRAAREPLVPVGTGQRVRCLQCVVEGLARGLAVRDQVFDPAAQAARAAGIAAPPRFRPQQPASQLERLFAGEVGGEGAVRRIEEVVALVEHVAGRHAAFVAGAEGRARRLHHEQRVVGNHHVGPPRLALALLDEAAAVVGAGAVDALAPAVREAEGAAVAEQVGEPGRQVAAGDVAVPRRGRPARHEAKRDAVPRHQRAAAQCLLHVEQAEVVLAPLAQHHLLRLDLGLRVEPVELLVDLALEVAREGGEPDRALVALGPEACRRDVAEGLADPGACFGQHHVGFLLRLDGVEGGAGGRGVVRLLGPGLGALAQQVREALSCGCRCDRVVARCRRRRALLPLLEPGPDRERAPVSRAARAWRRAAAGRQRRHHRIAPEPARAGHGARDGGCLVGARKPRRCERGEEGFCRLEQGRRLVLDARGQRQVERPREPSHRRHGLARRVHEGEELQHVQRRQRVQAEPAGGRLGVADVGRAAVGSKALGCCVVGEPRERAVLVQPGRVAWRHREHGRARQQRRP